MDCRWPAGTTADWDCPGRATGKTRYDTSHMKPDVADGQQLEPRHPRRELVPRPRDPRIPATAEPVFELLLDPAIDHVRIVKDRIMDNPPRAVSSRDHARAGRDTRLAQADSSEE